MAKTKSVQPPQLLVSFRLPDAAIAAELAAQAQGAGKSPGLFARDLVIGALIRPDELAQQMTKLAEELASINRTLKQVRLLRGDLATSVHILLAKAGQLQPDESRAWVTENLLQQP
jgi:hypothetical protein